MTSSQIIRKVLALFSFLFIFQYASAEPGRAVDEDYYRNDLQAAINEAARNNRNFDYSTRYWYNRSTSQSFDLPKLETDELDNAKIKGAVEFSAAGEPAKSDALERSEADQIDLVQSTGESVEQERRTDQRAPQTHTSFDTPKPLLVPGIITQTYEGGSTTSAQGITSFGTLNSTPRP